MASRFSRLFISLLDEKDMTQTELARATNVSVSYVNSVLKGRKLPSASWIELVGETCGVATAELHKQAAFDLIERSDYVVDLTKE